MMKPFNMDDKHILIGQSGQSSLPQRLQVHNYQAITLCTFPPPLDANIDYCLASLIFTQTTDVNKSQPRVIFQAEPK